MNWAALRDGEERYREAHSHGYNEQPYKPIRRESDFSMWFLVANQSQLTSSSRYDERQPRGLLLRIGDGSNKRLRARSIAAQKRTTLLATRTTTTRKSAERSRSRACVSLTLIFHDPCAESRRTRQLRSSSNLDFVSFCFENAQDYRAGAGCAGKQKFNGPKNIFSIPTFTADCGCSNGRDVGLSIVKMKIVGSGCVYHKKMMVTLCVLPKLPSTRVCINKTCAIWCMHQIWRAYATCSICEHFPQVLWGQLYPWTAVTQLLVPTTQNFRRATSKHGRANASETDSLMATGTVYATAPDAMKAVQDYALSMNKSVKVRRAAECIVAPRTHRTAAHDATMHSATRLHLVRVYRKRFLDKTYGH